MADFKWYLNRQGIQGRKGDKGEQGFSPIISEGINDADEYTLLVTNENNTFETPNLRGNFVINDDGVNSTVLYDRENNKLRTGEPVQATTEQLGAMVVASPEDFETINGNGKAVTVDNLVDNFTKIVGSSDGTVIITQDAETSKIDLKAKGTEIDDAVEVENKTWSSSKIMSTIDNMSNGFNQFIGNIMASISGELDKTNQNVTTNTNNITELQQEVTNTKSDVTALNASVSTLNSTVENHTESITTINNSISELNTNKVSKTELTAELAKKQNSLVAGDNITIVNNEDGTATISSAGSGGATGDVTAAGNNTFTGSNIFVGNSLNVGDGNSYYPVAEFDGQQVHYKYRPDSSSHVVKIGSGSIPISVNSILTTQYNSDENKYYGVFYLNQDSIVSSDGSVTIDKTPQGIDIKASGGSGATIDDNNISTTTVYSSDKTVNLATNLVDNAMITLNQTKQDTLVSGTNIKTINGQSILGEGDITISGGGGTGDVPIATTTTAGKVKPDGTTITVTEDGTISAVGDGGAAIDDTTASDTTTYSSNKITNLTSDLISNAADGQWVGVNLILFSKKTWEVGSNEVTYNLNDIIPNDGYNYEVLVSSDGNTGTTSGSQVTCGVKTSLVTSGGCILYRCQTRTSSSTCGGGSSIIPIGSNRNITLVMNVAGSNTSTTYGYVKAYRRIGKNQ